MPLMRKNVIVMTTFTALYDPEEGEKEPTVEEVLQMTADDDKIADYFWTVIAVPPVEEASDAS